MTPDTLADSLPKQMARVRDEVLPCYLALRGLPNVIVEPAIRMIEYDLARAITAMAQGDVVEMIRVYQSLKETT